MNLMYWTVILLIISGAVLLFIAFFANTQSSTPNIVTPTPTLIEVVPWIEFPGNPIYNPFPIIPPANQEDYWPIVIYSATNFDGNGPSASYKMWHQSDNGIAVSYSNDGINWFNPTQTTLTGTSAFHPCVVYDPNGFGGGLDKYKIWFWNGGNLNTVNILFASSTDGINFTVPILVTQSLVSPLVTGVAGAFFYHLYGPGMVMYNPTATSVPGLPYSFPYVMFFDTATEGFNPSTPNESEEIGLAYSSDGLFWTRYGNEPVLIPSGNVATDWNASYHFRPSVLLFNNEYHMFYSGSNLTVDPLTTIPYAHGIGHAVSVDGITWTKDVNPIFIFSNGVAWRNARTYTPSVILQCLNIGCTQCIGKMWFVGGIGTTAGVTQGIGYATILSCNLSGI